jgi:NAD(P)-dependent dehydrogenase (short-subunit alcohol dehydrogenase family)
MMLDGKTVLITGAARGIGRATALRLADEGANVAVVDILPEVEATAEAIKQRGRQSVWAVFDISDPDQVHAGVEKISQALGTVHALVNNAGIVNNVAPLARMTHEAWSRELAVNLTGAFNMIRAVIGPMVEARWGRIINLSSLAALGGLHHQVGYAASKAGILGLTKTVALEHARHGITCNAILPGLIDTELVQHMPEEIRENAIAMIPARRLGLTEEVAYLVAFLASDRAAYINGAEIPIDGGMRLNVTTLGSRKELKE